MAASSPSPNPTTVPVTPAGFACRLPLVRQLNPGHWQAGFLTLPAGTFAPDPNPSAPTGYYDLAVSMWLPVPRNAVAPDGLHYAFMTGGSPSQTPGPPRLHVLTAATGVDKVFDVGLPGDAPYGVEDYAADGIYIASGWEGSAFGNWRVEPASGAVVSLGTAELHHDDGTGHSWLAAVDPYDPKPATSAMSGGPLPNEIVRRDLKTGHDEVWFYRPGFSVGIIAAFLDGKRLVIAAPAISSGPQGVAEYWLLSAPGRSQLIAHINYQGQAMADRHGVWIGGSDGVYLFTAEGRVHRVTDVVGEPANGCF